jgi:hypothetical protein
MDAVFASNLLRGYWDPGTLHGHPQDLIRQHHVVAGACCSLPALCPHDSVGLEDVLPGEQNQSRPDVCTFNIVETMLWHVDITRQ